jgi:hypothetical protein
MCFFAQPETIQHLFFNYHFAKFIWTTIHIAFNIQKHLSVLHLFNDWTSGMGHNMQKLLLTGVDDIIFNNSPIKAYM